MVCPRAGGCLCGHIRPLTTRTALRPESQLMGSPPVKETRTLEVNECSKDTQLKPHVSGDLNSDSEIKFVPTPTVALSLGF